jgi:hypothetical protein
MGRICKTFDSNCEVVVSCCRIEEIGDSNDLATSRTAQIIPFIVVTTDGCWENAGVIRRECDCICGPCCDCTVNTGS